MLNQYFFTTANTGHPLDVLAEQVDQSRSVGITTLEDTSKAIEELATEQKSQEIERNSEAQHDTVALPPNSWWDYVGWGRTQPEETTQLPPISIDSAPPIEHAESAGTEFLSAVSTESPVVLSNTQSPLSPSQPSLQDSDADDTTKPASITSPEAATPEGQPSWLTPWNWYSSSAVTPSPPQPPLPPTEEENERGLTESQMIREAALSRDSQLPAPSSESDKVADTTEGDGKAYLDEVNPIRSTAGVNRSGWASFFMARSIKSITEDGEKKLIGNRADNGEMEVMEVPDPEGLPPDVTATATTTTTAAPAIPTPPPSGTSTMAAIVSQLVPKSSSASIKSSSSKVPGSPAQLPKKEIEKEPERGGKEPKKKDPLAPPLTNSENVKEAAKRTSERPSSPSPSKRSGTMSPRNGPLNLVLPTWVDTFDAPPRSLLPISMMRREGGKGESAVTKTIKTLWSKGWEVAGMGSVKGKERAGTQDEGWKAGPSELGDFGGPLPRALNVVGGQMDPNVLHGVCKIVVIGIAGWSPGAVTRTIAGGVSSLLF